MNKIVIKIFFLSIISAQSYSPNYFTVGSVVQDTFMSKGLLSNMVAEIKLMGDSLTWLGTGKGLALYDGKIGCPHFDISPLYKFSKSSPISSS